MSNEITITAVGWAATAPREIQDGRVPYTSFRLASTPRYYDRGQGAWAEGRTEWFTVKVFRDTALNVAGSVQKGHPVVVHGRLRTEEWQGEHGPRTGLVIEASALGHDLTRGRGSFVKVTRVAADAPAGAPDDAAGDTSTADPAPGTGPADPWAVDGLDEGQPDDGRPDEGQAEAAGAPDVLDREEVAATP